MQVLILYGVQTSGQRAFYYRRLKLPVRISLGLLRTWHRERR